MKKIVLFTAVLIFLGSCGKTNENIPIPKSEMNYVNFHNKEVPFNQNVSADINGDGIIDFSIYTLLVGDPQAKADYHQYYFGGSFCTDFPVNNKEEVPMLNKGNRIEAAAFTGYRWYNASGIVMAQKIITAAESHWEGVWKNASHQYLPLRIHVGEQTYYGWIEVSFDSASEKVILHNAGVSKEAEKVVKAGL